MRVNLATDDTDDKADFIRVSGGLSFRRYYSGGKRAPASVVPRPIVQMQEIDASAARDGDVYAQRPLRCNVYRASHTPN